MPNIDAVLNPVRLRLLSQLETLGTVRAVARAAHQSASSVSQQLAVLETEAGAELLERTGRRVQLTPAGHLLARRARDILDRMAVAEDELRALTEKPAGIVRIAAFQSAIHSLVVPAATLLGRTHDAIEVHIDEREPHESTRALLRGDADIAITTTDFLVEPRHHDLEIAALSTDPIVLVAPRGHPAADLEEVELAELADADWILDLPGTYMSELATRLCRLAGFEPHVVCRFNNYFVTLRHVESQGSVALLPALAVDRGYSVAIRPLRSATARHITAATRRSSGGRLSVQAVVAALLEAAETATPSPPR